jgi:hypothetical protein
MPGVTFSGWTIIPPTSNLDKYGREEDIFLKLNILSDPTISVTTRFTFAKGRKIRGQKVDHLFLIAAPLFRLPTS